MSETRKYKMIEEEALDEMIRTICMQSFSITLLTYICKRSGLQTSLTIPEACSVLELTPRQLKDARIRCQVRVLKMGGVFLYSAYDLCTIAAQLHRKKIIGQLKNVPTITGKAPQP